ncbi:hypothetical protein Goe7_c01660 [Bacillus phage vB_BveM-Goe7]|nr:hypothetical protein Goe7_c01660 [Bacillus phage vB_BveM-Goe7]
MGRILKNLQIEQNSTFWSDVDKALVKLAEFLDQELPDSAKEEVILLLEEVSEAVESTVDDAYGRGEMEGYSYGYDEGHEEGYEEGHEEGYDIGIGMNED